MLIPSMLWHCWLGVRKSMVMCLEWCADCLHTVQLMPLPLPNPSLASLFKSRLVLPFWYQLTQRPFNRCSSSSSNTSELTDHSPLVYKSCLKPRWMASCGRSTSAFRLWRRCESLPQQCYAHCLCISQNKTANDCFLTDQSKRRVLLGRRAECTQRGERSDWVSK